MNKKISKIDHNDIEKLRKCGVKSAELEFRNEKGKHCSIYFHPVETEYIEETKTTIIYSPILKEANGKLTKRTFISVPDKELKRYLYDMVIT